MLLLLVDSFILDEMSVMVKAQIVHSLLSIIEINSIVPNSSTVRDG